MVRDLQEGAHLAMENPFDKSIAITLELVLTEHLDPWDVNLIEFSKLYLKRVKKEEDIDFITAGRIMLMAWSVLRLQTEEVLTAIERVREEANGDIAEWFEDAPDWVAYEEPDYAYTREVLKKEEPVIEERVQRRTPRPVTLLELVDAFEEARRESDLRKEIESKRAAARERIKRERDVKVQRMMHKESLEEDIVETWERILTHNGSTIELEDLHKDGVEDYLTIFVAVLFLALHGRIKLWQKRFPFGNIYLKRLKDGKLGEELKAAQAVDRKNN
jgi:segregation and condensation protein A